MKVQETREPVLEAGTTLAALVNMAHYGGVDVKGFLRDAKLKGSQALPPP